MEEGQLYLIRAMNCRNSGRKHFAFSPVSNSIHISGLNKVQSQSEFAIDGIQLQIPAEMLVLFLNSIFVYCAQLFMRYVHFGINIKSFNSTEDRHIDFKSIPPHFLICRLREQVVQQHLISRVFFRIMNTIHKIVRAFLSRRVGSEKKRQLMSQYGKILASRIWVGRVAKSG